MLFTWACENYPLFEHAQKTHIPDFFWFICLMVLMFSIGSLHHDPKSDALVNRDQTEEWKGWMQTAFLLYHYFHEEEVYNAIRIFVSCYVWMTGFGNFSFFYIRQDFGFVRFAQMMWRLNFLVFFLSLTLNNTYILYYICPLHTFYFLLVFVTMYVLKQINHTKYSVRVKLLAVGVLIYFIWEFNSAFELVFGLLSNEPHPGAAVGAYGIRYEWHFRSGLDHYSTYFGMIFACNFPQSTQWIQMVESLPKHQEWFIKGSVGATLLGAFWWWATEIFPLDKLQFNSYNPYTFMIPLLTYLFFRNLTPWLRQVHLGVLADIGKYTLETYLLQHHVWLTTNAKTVLVFVPDSPKVNLVVVTFVYFVLARRLFRITMVSRALLMPDSPAQTLGLLGASATALALAGLTGCAVQMFSLGWGMVTILVIAIGILLAFTSESMVTRHRGRSPEFNPGSWNRAVIFFLFGSVSALISINVLPSMFNLGAPVNAGPLRHATKFYSEAACIEKVKYGSWLDSGNKLCKSTYSPICNLHSWTWTDHVAEKLCHYQHFTSEDARELLNGRTILFVGDSNTLYTASALYRLAEPSAGQFLPFDLDTGDVSSSSSALWPISTAQKGTIQYMGATNYDGLADRLKSDPVATSAEIIVVGAWLEDMSSKSVSREFAAKSSVKQLEEVSHAVGKDRFMVLSPPTVFESKLAGPLATRLAQSNTETYIGHLNLGAASFGETDTPTGIETLADFVIDLHAITANASSMCEDGVHYSSDVYDVAVQQMLFVVNKHHPNKVAESTTGKSQQTKKGQGGGVAMSPTWGMATLTLAAIMLFSMDVYGGVSVFLLKMLPPHLSLNYDTSVAELHQKIGVVKPHETNDVEDPDIYDPEEDEKFIDHEEGNPVEHRSTPNPNYAPHSANKQVEMM